MSHRQGRIRMSVAIGQVDIGSVIDNPTVDLFRNTHVEAASPGFHVKYRILPPLRRDDDQVAVGVSQHEECIRPTGRQHGIGGYDQLADGFRQRSPPPHPETGRVS